MNKKVRIRVKNEKPWRCKITPTISPGFTFQAYVVGLAQRANGGRTNAHTQRGKCCQNWVSVFATSSPPNISNNRIAATRVDAYCSLKRTRFELFSQVLDADRGCRGVVHKLQAVCAAQSKPLPISLTAAYCQARAHLELTILEHTFEVGDIFLGDKGFCSYDDVWAFPTQGVDSVITLARRTPVTEAESVKVLGDNDRLIRWPKPVHRQVANYSHAQWADSLDSLLLRQIKVTVERPVFRVTACSKFS
jgi:hypothetical protein